MKAQENSLVGQTIWLWSHNRKTKIVQNTKTWILTECEVKVKLSNISKQPRTKMLLENPVGEMPC